MTRDKISVTSKSSSASQILPFYLFCEGKRITLTVTACQLGNLVCAWWLIIGLLLKFYSKRRLCVLTLSCVTLTHRAESISSLSLSSQRPSATVVDCNEVISCRDKLDSRSCELHVLILNSTTQVFMVQEFSSRYVRLRKVELILSTPKVRRLF